MIVLNYIAFILLAIGGLNWGLIGIFNFNLVSAIFGAGMNFGNSFIYILVFLSMLWLIFSIIYNRGVLLFTHR